MFDPRAEPLGGKALPEGEDWTSKHDPLGELILDAGLELCEQLLLLRLVLQEDALLPRLGREQCLLVRSGLNNLFIFSKLREARSRLYRRQIVQLNIRWKALDEIYKIYILLHRSDLKSSAKKSRHNFGEIEYMKIQLIRIFASLTVQLLCYF